MDLLDRLLRHDARTTRQLLQLSRDLPEAQLNLEFDLGKRTLQATLGHIVRNVEIWSALMDASPDTPITPEDADAIAPPAIGSIDALITRHDIAAARLARIARDIAESDGWDETWLDTLDDPPTEKTYGGAIGHVITHSMHHRGQVLHMLRRLGIDDVPEGDVLSWERQFDAT